MPNALMNTENSGQVRLHTQFCVSTLSKSNCSGRTWMQSIGCSVIAFIVSSHGKVHAEGFIAAGDALRRSFDRVLAESDQLLVLRWMNRDAFVIVPRVQRQAD